MTELPKLTKEEKAIVLRAAKIMDDENHILGVCNALDRAGNFQFGNIINNFNKMFLDDTWALGAYAFPYPGCPEYLPEYRQTRVLMLLLFAEACTEEIK